MTRFFAFLSIAVLAIAQSTDFRVDGTVLDAETGQPVANAHLQIGAGPVCQARREASLTTGEDGAFEAPLKTAGRYTICIQRDGYITERTLTMTQCSPCTPTFRIHAEATVSGRVLSAETKEPIGRMDVEAIQVHDSYDIATSRSAATVRSSPTGQFSLEHLLPGQYFFRFTPLSSTPLLVDDGHNHTLATQWWPGGDSARDATPFTLAAGTSFRMPDIWIPAAPRYQISGTVAATICQADDAYHVTIGEHRGASVAILRSMLTRCGAEFRFSDLAPGRYQLSLLPKDGGDALAKQDAVITDRDLQKNFPSD